MPDRDLTIVSVSWRNNRRNNRILFGDPDRWVRLNWQRKLAVFAPGRIFAYERWRGDKYGTQSWQVFVLQTPEKSELVSRVPGVRPGAIVLLAAHGKDRSKRALSLLDDIRKQGGADLITTDRWLCLASRFDARLPHNDLLKSLVP